MSERIVVGVGEYRVAQAGATLMAVGLGSCVAIVLHDPVHLVGGLAHALLPDPSAGRRGANPGRFVTTALPLLLEALGGAGADRTELNARIVGGATMFTALSNGTSALGDRNVEAARLALARAGIRLVGEAVGGEYGRSVFFDVAVGRVRVTSVHEADVLL